MTARIAGAATTGHRRMMRLGVALKVVLAVLSIPLAASARTNHAPLICPAANGVPIAPNAVHGVVTRIQTNPKLGPDIVYTIQPNLAGLDLVTWMRHLERAGANMAELYLQPDDRLSPSESVGRSTWDTYVNAGFATYQRMTPEQQSAYRAVRSQITAVNGVQQITPAQQDQVLIAFLQELEALKRSGQICGNVQFIIAERRWFPTREPLSKQFASEIVYSRTLAGLVNQASTAGLGHWLAGFLLTEHTNTDMNQVLPIGLDLAMRINKLTRNWLMSHLMIIAGGGYGDQFNGIDHVICPSGAGKAASGYQFRCRPGQPLNFFGLIAGQTGSFAFAYKLFNWRTAPSPASYCAAHISGCDPTRMTAAEWLEFLNDNAGGLGFSDLASFVTENAARYPKDANVMFIGDATDTIYMMTKVMTGPGGTILMPLPPMIALTHLFTTAAKKGGGWSGRLFMDGYGDEDRIFNVAQQAVDDGLYLFYVDYSPSNFTGSGRVRENPQSRAYWRAWPSIPSALP
jgi:hypothetical protein